MRLVPVLVALALGVAAPARADKRLDDAVAKSERQLAEGKADDAVETLRKVASRSSRDPEASLALANLLSRLGRLEEAGVALAEAGERAVAGRIRWNGFRLLEEALRSYLERGRRLRVLTTTYVGATERRAVDRLAELGAGRISNGRPTG